MLGGTAAWASWASASVLAQTYSPHEADFPVPWPLTEAELDELRAERLSQLEEVAAAESDETAAQADETVGMTIVNWWQRFGTGALPDSIQALERTIEPWPKKLAA